MGCASSSPVVNGEGVHSATGSMAETMAEQAKSATNNAIEAGEQVLNDAGEAITGAVDAAEEKMSDAVTSMKQGMDGALSSGMAFMKSTSTAMQEKAGEMGEDLKAAGNDLMQHVPLKDEVGDAVEDLMAQKAREAEQMADDLMADTEEMVKDVGAGMQEAMSMVGLPKSMDSFKTGSPEPELQKLEEMSMTMPDSPKPSNSLLELVDLEATPTPQMMIPPESGMSAETTTNYTPPTDTTSPPATTANLVPSLILPNGISTPADTLLLGEIIREGATTIEGGGDNDMNNGSNAFHLPPPSPRHDGILLTEPTQWEQFADSIVKTHLDKTLRRGGGAISATTAAAMAAVVGTNGSDEHPATEQNIEL